MEEIDLKKYSEKSLDFIHRQSEKLLEETINSFKEVTNKSYIIISVYFSVQVFSLKQIIQEESSKYLILLVSFLIPIVFIFKNIFPGKIQRVGTKGSLLIDEFYEDENYDSQIKLYYSTRIEDVEESIEINLKEIENRVFRLKWSLISAIVCVLIVGVYWFLVAKSLV